MCEHLTLGVVESSHEVAELSQNNFEVVNYL